MTGVLIRRGNLDIHQLTEKETQREDHHLQRTEASEKTNFANILILDFMPLE